EELRALPLIESKARFKNLLRRRRCPGLYVDHLEARSRPFFENVCDLDLEGIVAKRKTGAHRATDARPSPDWLTIKNPRHWQAEGGDESFHPQPEGITKV